MRFKDFIIFILTLLIFGCDGSYQSNDDEIVTELNIKNTIKFLAVGDTGTILTSTDGTSWTERNSGTSNKLNDIDFGNNNYVTAGSTGLILSSNDGMTWTPRSSGTSQNITALKYVNSKFMGVTSYGGHIIESRDTITWSMASDEIDTHEFHDLIFANNIYLIVGLIGNGVMTSTDGSTWTPRTADGNRKLGVVYGDNIFVMVGNGGDLMTSSDGLTWNSRTTGVSSSLNDITYGNNKFIVVGDTGIILSSTDGISWSTISSGTTNQLIDITYGDNKFVVVGVSGTILTSTNGSSWMTTSSGTANTLNAVEYIE